MLLVRAQPAAMQNTWCEKDEADWNLRHQNIANSVITIIFW